MLDLEDNPTKIGNYVFERHEGTLFAMPQINMKNMTIEEYDDYKYRYGYRWYAVDFFWDLIDALEYFKEEGLDIKLTGEEFKQLIEGAHASLYTCNGECYGEDCGNCKNEDLESGWVNFNRYYFIKDYGAFRRLVLIRDDYKCLCCGNDNEKD